MLWSKMIIIVVLVLLIVQSTVAGPSAYLIAPHMASDAGYTEFWNDTVNFYDALIGTGQYTSESIYVAYGDGQNITHSTSNPRYASRADIIDGDATRAGINAGFARLQQQDLSQDHLTVFTFDHGGRSAGDEVEAAQTGDVYLLTQDRSHYTDNTFASRMADLEYGSASVFMQQCRSGGFINELQEIENTLIMTATGGNKLAYRGSYRDSIYGDPHGEFNYHMTSSMTGLNPDGSTYGSADTNLDGTISMDEVWASVSSSMTTSTPQYSDVWGLGGYDWSLGLSGANVAAVPVPGAGLLAGFGASIIGWVRRRRMIS